MKSFVRGLLPKGLRRRLRRGLARFAAPLEFTRDGRRYLRHCAPADLYVDDSLRGRQLECQLTKDYHRVEKGLSLSAPKSPFGAEVERRLAMLIPLGASTSPNASYTRYAQDAHSALMRWNAGDGIDDEVSPPASGLPVSRWTTDDVGAFITSRRSVRHFDPDRAVDTEILRHAVDLASNTPSVCNRQAWKVRFFLGDRAKRVLQYQNGNAGFRQQIPCVAVVTVDSRLFAGISERNQPWIDGGLFSMSLVYALHGLGLQTCMLNMSVTNAQAERARKAIGADDAEQVVMMIAVGHAAAQYRIARSPRRNLDELVEIVG
jgi:nitroreductase